MNPVTTQETVKANSMSEVDAGFQPISDYLMESEL